MKKLFTYKSLLLAVLLFTGFSHIAQASSLVIDTGAGSIKMGRPFTATISLSTDGKSINTIEGDLNYDPVLLAPSRVNVGDSFISLWVERPNTGVPGVIHFSGIIPGGVSVQGSHVFSVVFQPVSIGNTAIALSDVNLFLNDGEGSKDSATIKNSSIAIELLTGGEAVEEQPASDKIPPEKFTIERTRSPYVFDNKWFVVFNTTDKGSGIDHYEVCEFTRRNCVRSESPSVLKNETFLYRIIVRAYDADGNVRDATLTSPWLLGLLILFASLLLYACHRFSKKHTI